MNTPVNSQLAKLLKQKGYNEPCALLYDENGKISGTKMGMGGNPNNYINKYSAPTIAEVVMWLYEKHGIWIYSYHNGTSFIGSIQDASGSIKGRLFPGYTTPTEAYEAAILYTLKNLIP